MERRTFDPHDWLTNEEPVQQAPAQAPATAPNTPPPPADASDIENIITSIENARIDITATYAKWRNIGFAFAEGFGESGRNYFHRISCFYPGYNKAECDRQYDNCLKSKGHGITLKTFFYHAQQAGINRCAQKLQEEAVQNCPPPKLVGGEQCPPPLLHDDRWPILPAFLQKVVAHASTAEERDILLLGTLVALSACFPNVHGIYDGKKVHPNLFLFITSRASAGKGRLVHCKQLVLPIHKHLREQARLLRREYEIQLAEFNQQDKDLRGEKPAKPAEKMLLIPANNSTTGVFQLLHENEGRGMIFETEGDTLAQAFKSDYGNYSDGFRKAFHHETISYYRRTDREYVDIESPCLSTILSGTPRQVSALIPNAENGLFSRFIFYYMNVQPEWKNVFAFSSDNSLDDYFKNLGLEFLTFYNHLLEGPEIEFCLTPAQQEQFNQFFAQVQDVYISLKGLDYMATVRRLGLIAFRISMILSALRIWEHGEYNTKITCEEEDFQTTLAMIRVLVKHAAKVFSELPEEEQLPRRKNKKERFLEALPRHFNKQVYTKIAATHGIPDKTAQSYITEFCKNGLLHRDQINTYINLVYQEVKELQDLKDTQE